MFEWQKEMSVGIDEFDSHHKRIIELINKLQNALFRGDDKSVTRDVLTEVANYTIYHFFVEEELMEKYHYPEYLQHRQAHLDLTSKTFELMGEAQTKDANIGKEVLDFLIDWLIKHIMITDKRYSAFFQDRKIHSIEVGP